MKTRFTKTAIAGLSPGESRYFIYDSETPNLAVCVSPAGRKTFYRCGKVRGRAMRVHLGAWPAITVQVARKLTLKVSAEIANGIDPQAEKRTARNEPTLRDLFEWYLEHHAKPHLSPRTWQGDEQRFRTYLSQWSTRRLSQITRTEIVSLHTRLGATIPVGANKVINLLRVLFRHGIRIGWCKANPAADIKRFKQQPRERYLQPDELPKFFAALEHVSPLIRDFLLMCLFSGARRGNVQAMRWEDIDIDAGVWQIPAEQSKSRRSMRIVLPAAATEILQRRVSESSSEWVFPGRGSKTGHIAEPKRGWNRVRELAGIGDVRLHDLRRTLGSWQAAGGSSLAIIGKSLGHSNPSSTAIYARLNLDPVRESVEKATAAMLDAASDGFSRK